MPLAKDQLGEAHLPSTRIAACLFDVKVLEEPVAIVAD